MTPIVKLAKKIFQTNQENAEKYDTLLIDQQQQLWKNEVKNYQTIDFNDLYSLLQKIAEREQNNWLPGSWKWN